METDEKAQEKVGFVRSLIHIIYQSVADFLSALWKLAKKHPIKSEILLILILSIYPPYHHAKRKTGEFDFGKYFDQIMTIYNDSQFDNTWHSLIKTIEEQIKNDILKKYPLGSDYRLLEKALLKSGLEKSMTYTYKDSVEMKFKTPIYEFWVLGNFIPYTLTPTHLWITFKISHEGMLIDLYSKHHKKIL